MTILEKLAIISDLLGSSGENLSSVEVAASYFMNALPHDLAKEFYIPVSIPVEGVKCGSKYSTVIRGIYRCRKIHPGIKQLALVEGSQYEATETDPLYYKENSKIFVIPEPTVGSPAFVSKMPTEFLANLQDDTVEEIPNIPENSEHIVLLYAGYLILYKKSRDSRAASQLYITSLTNVISAYESVLPNTAPSPVAFTFTEVAPTNPAIDTNIETHTVSLVDVVDLNYNVVIDLSDLNLSLDTTPITNITIDLSTEFSAIVEAINDNTFDFTITPTSTLPAFDISDIAFPVIDLSGTFSAIQKASDFIGKLTVPTPDTGAHTPTGVPTGAFWLDDEDPEMVSSAVQLAAQEVNRANSIANSQLSSLNTYKTQVDARFTEFKAKAEAYISEIQFKAQEANAKLSVYQGKIDGKAKELQGRVQVINSKLGEIQSQVQQAVSKLQLDLQSRTEGNQSRFGREQIKLQEFTTELNNYQARVQKAVQREQMLLQEWQSQVQQKIQYNQQILSRFQNDLGLYTTKFQTALNTWSANNTNVFQVFTSSLNLASGELQTAGIINSQFQMKSQEYQQYLGEAQMLYQKYLNEFNRFLSLYGSTENNRKS